MRVEAELVCATFTHGGFAKTRGHVIVECTLCGVVGTVTGGEKKNEQAAEIGAQHERSKR